MIDCPICHKSVKLLFDKAKDYFILNGNSPDFKIFNCESCGLASSQPDLTDEELKDYYPEEYEAYVQKKSLEGFLQILKYQSDLKLIKKIVAKERASLFEVGAGRGEFLAQAKKNGFDVSGLEPSAAGRRAAKNLFNIELLDGFADKLNLKEKYDVIVMRHVFEHIGDPVRILKIIKSGLANNGIIFLKLPRLDSWEAKVFKKYWHGYDLPRHRFHYSAKGIIKMLKNSGFDLIKIKQENVPSDIIRSLKYYNLGEHNFLSRLIKVYLFLPSIIKLILAQLAAIVLSPFISGRMIVVAKYR